MTAKDAIKYQMETSLMVLNTYIGDLSDADLMVRSAKGVNHIAWQLGHLVASEAQLLEGVCPGAAAPLPTGFKEQHSKETVGIDDPKKFRSKAEYVALFEKQRAATNAALDKLPDADLDKPGPPDFKICPTVGSVFGLIASHPMMHAGQFVPVRRQLGKPVLI